MKRIDRSEVLPLLKAGKRGALFCTIFLASPQDKRLRKTGNPYDVNNIVKEVAVNGCVGGDYAAGINRLASKEGKPARESKGRKWGTLSPCRKVVEYKGRQYVQMLVRSSTKPVYRSGKDIIPTELLEPFIPSKRKSSTQQDLDGEVVCRDIAVDNILMIRYGGEDYLVGDLEPATKPEALSVAKVNQKVDELLAEICNLKAHLKNGELTGEVPAAIMPLLTE